MFHKGSRTSVAFAASSSEFSQNTLRNPSRSIPRALRRSAIRCARTTCGPNCRSWRPAFRARQTCSGVFMMIATGRQWNSRARSTSPLRSSARTLVASITVSRPRARRVRAT